MDKEPQPTARKYSRREILGFVGISATVAVALGFGKHWVDEQYADVEQIRDLIESPDEVVAGLGDLEARVGDETIFSGAMQFLDVSIEGASSWQATEIAETTKAKLFSLNVVELDGLNLTDPASEQKLVHEYFETLFGELDIKGVNRPGTFVLAPEFIAGFNGNPSDYAANLNMFLREIDGVASVTTSNMIDTSEVGALLPQLGEVDTNRLDNVGFQAFANSQRITFDKHGKADISGYLNPQEIEEVMARLGRKPVWLNTGFIRQDANLGVSYSLNERLAIADATADVIGELKASNLKVAYVNIFAENKLNGRDRSANKEGRDFSFHSGDEEILASFSNRMENMGVKLSGYALHNDTLKTK